MERWGAHVVVPNHTYFYVLYHKPSSHTYHIPWDLPLSAQVDFGIAALQQYLKDAKDAKMRIPVKDKSFWEDFARHKEMYYKEKFKLEHIRKWEEITKWWLRDWQIKKLSIQKFLNKYSCHAILF